MAAGNPFWDVHNAIWTRLAAVSDFATNVPAGNRIDFTADPETILSLKRASTQGRPEVAVVDAGAVIRDRCASNATRITRKWEIWLRSCERDVDLYFTICFAITRAMLDWDKAGTGLKTLVWTNAEHGFNGSVRNCDLLSSDETILGSKIAPKTNGWSAKWIGVTDLWFDHLTLVSE